MIRTVHASAGTKRRATLTEDPLKNAQQQERLQRHFNEQIKRQMLEEAYARNTQKLDISSAKREPSFRSRLLIASTPGSSLHEWASIPGTSLHEWTPSTPCSGPISLNIIPWITPTSGARSGSADHLQPNPTCCKPTSTIPTHNTNNPCSGDQAWHRGIEALPPDAAPVVTAAAIPVVTVSFAVSDLTVASFTPDLKQALLDSITATLPATANTQVYITNIRDGSLLFDTVVLFLDGDTDAAQTLTATAAAVRSKVS
ncbi:hypothetical protein WJX84_009636 [Apatococcus fuscideae]|uniref:Uncharacterized protein n=1 Tax=Apatococcus fuscideae TaxID=2026836 RepID=A0AAW1SGS6_9CHLO